MNKLLICSAFFALSVSIISCNKSEKNKLIGTWKITETAGDDNNNKVPDASEKRPMASNADHRYTFKSDGTVHMNFIDGGICGTIEDGTWTLKNDILEITFDGVTEVYNIQSLTNKELKTQSDHQTGYRSWMTLVKQ